MLFPRRYQWHDQDPPGPGRARCSLPPCGAVSVINRHGSTPVDEDAVAKVLDALKNQPGGILNVSRSTLNKLAETMTPHDFAALKFDLADAQWQAENTDRLDQLSETPASRNRLRGWR